MSTDSIGYVETVGEDLLDAAWRSTMSAPIRAPRRRVPSRRWLIAAATGLTLIAAGIVGWLVTTPQRASIRAENGSIAQAARDLQHRAPTGPSTTPAPSDQEKLVQGIPVPAASPAPAAFGDAVSGGSGAAGSGAVQGVAAGASINPIGDLSKVIKSASLSIVVGHDTFGDRFTRIGDIADRLGGYLQSSSTTGGKSGFVTMRIPAKHFQSALRSLRGLGRVDAEQVRGNDVTAQYVDLSARLRIALARRRVLFGLMNQAVSIEQTIRVQNALDDVQLRIEDLQGEINVLNNRVSEATIRVSMREVGVKRQTTATVTNPSIPNAFDRAVAGFFSVVAGVIVGLGWVLPTLALLLLLWFVVTRVRRRLA
ncbi:MAG: DUF4349 domain-containing protein [Actinomycetota bacterium]